MTAHEVYAHILGEDVMNVVVADNYTDADLVAKAVYGDEAFAVDCRQYPCGIGDKYINGVFYQRDGVTPIEYIPTQEQQVETLKADNLALMEALVDNDYRITTVELGL